MSEISNSILNIYLSREVTIVWNWSIAGNWGLTKTESANGPEKKWRERNWEWHGQQCNHSRKEWKPQEATCPVWVPRWCSKDHLIQLHSAMWDWGQGELRSFKLLKPGSVLCNSVLMTMLGAGSVHRNDLARKHGSDAVIDRHNGLQNNFSSLRWLTSCQPTFLHLLVSFPHGCDNYSCIKWLQAIMVKVTTGAVTLSWGKEHLFQRIWSTVFQLEGGIHICAWRSKG